MLEQQEPHLVYQLKPSFYKVERILKIAIVLQFILICCRIMVKNQAQLLLPDALNVMLMLTTFYQKNYCLAIVSMFFNFSLIYLTTLFMLGFLQAHLPLFIEPFSNFTYMLIFSGILYIIEAIANYLAYKEYKAIIYELTQIEIQQQHYPVIQQEQGQQNLDQLSQIPEQQQESDASVSIIMPAVSQLGSARGYQQSIFNQHRNQAQPQGDINE